MIETNAFHHVEIHTTRPDYLIDLFSHIYGFQAVAQRETPHFRQWLLKSTQCQFLISSISTCTNDLKSLDDQHYDIITTIMNNPNTRSFILDRDTVFNVALIVKSVSSVLERIPEVEIVVPRREAKDQFGLVEYACIKSCVGNVVHTLIDLSQYNGSYLPGFQPMSNTERSGSKSKIVRGIDHVAFAIHRNEAVAALNWYEKALGMKRFIVNQEDDPFQGFSVRVGSMGMRLFASDYWKCAETACVDQPASNLKFVFAESMLDENSKTTDQITKFISQQHNQSGIQHIGFTCLGDIKEAVKICKENGAQFLNPSHDYYLKENNGSVIEQVGEDPRELGELGILLDREENRDSCLNGQEKVLLQIFTKSIFNNDTFFLELIERRGALGFGAGNIRTLWKIVQRQTDMNS